MAVPAHVITMGLDRGMNTSIRTWFQQFNILPPIPLAAAKVDTVMHDVSFARLLEMMVTSPHKNFILVIHGHEDGSGLWLRLAPGQGRPHTTHHDLQRLMDLDAGGPAMSRADQLTMGISDEHRRRILTLMHRLRDKRIDCVEFRSCNLGRNTLSLGRFRRFLGARLAGAPDLHTVFGVVPALTGAFLQTHTRHHPGQHWETYNFPNALTNPRLVCCFQLNPLSKPEAGGHIAADTPATLDAWIKEYVMSGGSHGSGDLAMHALWIADRAVSSAAQRRGAPPLVPAAIELEPADLNDPLGGWGGPAVRRFIPPRSPNYAKHIIYTR